MIAMMSGRIQVRAEDPEEVELSVTGALVAVMGEAVEVVTGVWQVAPWKSVKGAAEKVNQTHMSQIRI